jgi:hypothetical protein
LSHNYPSNNARARVFPSRKRSSFICNRHYAAAQYIRRSNRYPISKVKPMFNLLHLLVLAMRPTR